MKKKIHNNLQKKQKKRVGEMSKPRNGKKGRLLSGSLLLLILLHKLENAGSVLCIFICVHVCVYVYVYAGLYGMCVWYPCMHVTARYIPQNTIILKQKLKNKKKTSRYMQVNAVKKYNPFFTGLVDCILINIIHVSEWQK